MVRVGRRYGSARAAGSCESAGRSGWAWCQMGPEAPGFGKTPDDRKSSLLCKYLSLSDLRLIQVPFPLTGLAKPCLACEPRAYGPVLLKGERSPKS